MNHLYQNLVLIAVFCLFESFSFGQNIIVTQNAFTSWEKYELEHFEAPAIKLEKYNVINTYLIKYKSAPHQTAIKISTSDSSIQISENITLIKLIRTETMYWKNGALRHIKTFENDTPFGIWKYWDINGNLKFTFEFIEKSKCIAQQYYPTGKTQSVTLLDQMSNISEQTYYFESGLKKRSGKRKLSPLRPLYSALVNLQIGKWKYWHPNGQLMQKGKFVEGKKEGIWKFYNKNGILLRKLKYKKGEEIKQFALNK